MKFSVNIYIPENSSKENKNSLLNCLKSIEENNLKDSIEIILLDSSQNQKDLHYVKEFNLYIRRLDLKGKSKSQAFNEGIKNSSYEIVIFIESNMYMDSDFFQKIQLLFEKMDVDVIRWLNIGLYNTKKGEAIKYALSSKFTICNGIFRNLKEEIYLKNDSFIYGAYKKELFQILGYFDEKLDDFFEEEFFQRLKRNDKKVLLTPNIKVYKEIPENYSSLWCQSFNEGKRRVKVTFLYPSTLRIKYVTFPLFFIFIILSLFLSLFIKYVWLVGVGIFCIRLILNLIFSFKIAKKEGLSLFLHLPLAFDSIHFGYGIGFLYGLILYIWKQKILGGCYETCISNRGSWAYWF